MDHLVSPSRDITIAGVKYTLDGSFGTLRKLEEHFRLDLVRLLTVVIDMPASDIADMIAIGSGQRDKVGDIGQVIMDDIGLMSSEYVTLKTELVAWLHIAIAPKAEREKKSKEMQAIIDAQIASRSPSPGQVTSA